MSRGARRALARLSGGALVVFAILGLFAPIPAPLVERWYSQALYIHFQRILTPVSNLLTIAFLDPAAIAAVVALVLYVRSLRRSRTWVSVLKVVSVRLVVFAAAGYVLFLACWGLNYRRVPLEEKLDFDSEQITREATLALGREAVAQVNESYAGAHAQSPDPMALSAPFADAQRLLGARVIAQTGVPKRSLLGLYFRWAAIDGMTDPFFLEIIVNPDVLPIERPFVVAHEWAHLAGYAEESEANFVAWLTCAHGDALAQYSGWLALYAHLSNALPRDDRRALSELIAPGPRQDLVAINARLLRSAPAVRRAARDVYDSYLKANRVERGIASYDAVVRLALGVRFDEGWRPRLKAF
jgi:Protein of unknown function (DUF3810)